MKSVRRLELRYIQRHNSSWLSSPSLLRNGSDSFACSCSTLTSSAEMRNRSCQKVRPRIAPRPAPCGVHPPGIVIAAVPVNRAVRVGPFLWREPDQLRAGPPSPPSVRLFRHRATCRLEPVSGIKSSIGFFLSSACLRRRTAPDLQGGLRRIHGDRPVSAYHTHPGRILFSWPCRGSRNRPVRGEGKNADLYRGSSINGAVAIAVLRRIRAAFGFISDQDL